MRLSTTRPAASRSTMLPALGEGGAPEPLVGLRRPLVACGRDLFVTHNRVDLVVVGQGFVERDAGAERQDGLVARVGKGRRRLEADPRSPDAEGHVGRMVELQRFGQVEARARIPSGCKGPLKVLRADCVPTFVTVTVSIPCPTLSMSNLILSPTEMLATDDTLMLVSPAFASADSQACVPGLPTAVTVTTSYFSTAFATVG